LSGQSKEVLVPAFAKRHQRSLALDDDGGRGARSTVDALVAGHRRTETSGGHPISRADEPLRATLALRIKYQPQESAAWFDLRCAATRLGKRDDVRNSLECRPLISGKRSRRSAKSRHPEAYWTISDLRVASMRSQGGISPKLTPRCSSARTAEKRKAFLGALGKTASVLRSCKLAGTPATPPLHLAGRASAHGTDWVPDL
jgi:hypothetical protein